MARAKKYQDGVVRTVRKDWKYYKGKKTRSWRLIFEYLMADGRKERITERFEHQGNAELRLTKLEREHNDKAHAFEHRDLTFAEYAESYKASKLAFIIDGKVTKLHLRSGKTECSKVDMMIAFFGSHRKLAAIRRIQAKAFKTHLQGLTSDHTKRPLEPRTVNSYLERLRALLTEAMADDLIASVPDITSLIDKHLEVTRDVTITTPQFFRLLKECDTPIKHGGRFRDRKHLRLPLIASHETGCRIGELKDVTRADILHIDHERKSGILRAPIEKSRPRKYKKVPITSWLYDEIMDNGILDLPADAAAFVKFGEYKTAWKKLKELSEIDAGLHWHDLRAVNATNRKYSGQAFDDLQEQVGHTKGSNVTEKHYIRPQDHQLMDSIQGYNDYMAFERQRAEDVIEAGSIS